jgi:hypothetical protein
MAYQQVTLAELRYLLETRYTGDAFWTVTDANDAINEALRYFNAFTGYWRGTVTVSTTAGLPFLLMPAPLTSQTRVYVAGRVLTLKSLVGWYRTKRNWRSETTTSGASVPTTIREWAPVGLTFIAIWPTDPFGGTILSVDGVRVTPILETDGSFVDMGQEVQGAIQAEALYILAYKRPSLLESFTPYHQEFLQACLEKNDQLRASSYFRKALGLPQQFRLEPLRVPKEDVDARA